MKQIYSRFILGIALLLALSLHTQAQTNACNELFISEIVYAKDQIAVSGNSTIDKSYALELFNPKGTNVDLTGYFIKLAVSAGADINIPLSGNITSKGTFVVGFAGSDIPVTQLSEMLSASLNFEEKTRVELWNANGIIDRIGQVNITQGDAINIALALADPVNYLNTLNLNLTSLQNFTARRKYSESQGDPYFAQPANKWEMAANGDITNLGVYNNVCSESEAPAQLTWSVNTTNCTGIPGYPNYGQYTYEEDDVIELTISKPLQVNFIAQHDAKIMFNFSNFQIVPVTNLYSRSEIQLIEWTLSSGPWVSNITTFDGDYLNDINRPYVLANFSLAAFDRKLRFHLDLDNIVEPIEEFSLQMVECNGVTSPWNNCIKINVGNKFTALSLNENNINQSKIYFNNSNNEIFIKGNQDFGTESIVIFDVAGKKVFDEKLNSNKISVNDLENGIYVACLVNQNNTQQFKFVKR